MSAQVDTAFVEDFRRGIDLLVQQGESRMRPASRVETGVVGETASFDQIGATAAQRRVVRHADTPQVDTPHAKRNVTMFDYDWGDLLDKPDKVKLLNDPTNAYSRNASKAMMRAMDDELIAAIGGTALTGKGGTTSTAFLAAHQVAAGGAGMTVAKIQQATRLLKAAENDRDEPWYIVMSAAQEEDLLNDATTANSTNLVTSSDYVAGQPLMSGQIERFMGLNFILSERLLTDGSGDRLCYAWRQSALLLAIGQDSMADIGPRRDKSMSMQVFYSMTIGATRMEELGVVEIACVE